MAHPKSDILLALHIPKTGGTTLKKLLEAHLLSEETPPLSGDGNGALNKHYCDGVFYYPRNMEEYYADGRVDPSVDPTIPKEVVELLCAPRLRAVLGHFPFGIHSHIPGPSRYFTLLRNPIERLMSLYFHILKWPRTALQKQIVRDGLTLEQFATQSGYRQADNGQTRRLAGLEPDFGVCYDDLLAQAKRNVAEHFVMVGLTERFDESLVLLRRALGWSLNLQYWKRLENKERPSMESIDAGTLAVLRERNWLDMQLYAYVSELFDEQVRAAGSGFVAEAEQVRLQNSRANG